MNVDHVLDDFGLRPYKQLFKPLYESALRVADLDATIREKLDLKGGDDTIWDKLSDVLDETNQEKEIVEIIGIVEPEAVVELFSEARICWMVCEDYLESHPLAFTMDIQVYNTINMFMNLGAAGPEFLSSASPVGDRT